MQFVGILSAFCALCLVGSVGSPETILVLVPDGDGVELQAGTEQASVNLILEAREANGWRTIELDGPHSVPLETLQAWQWLSENGDLVLSVASGPSPGGVSTSVFAASDSPVREMRARLVPGGGDRGLVLNTFGLSFASAVPRKMASEAVPWTFLSDGSDVVVDVRGGANAPSWHADADAPSYPRLSSAQRIALSRSSLLVATPAPTLAVPFSSPTPCTGMTPMGQIS
jgi:hypothetical protein